MKSKTVTVADISKDGEIHIINEKVGHTTFSFTYNRLDSASKAIAQMRGGNIFVEVADAEIPKEITDAINIIREYLYQKALEAEGMND